MEIKLGFCKAPEPVHLYIKKEEIDGKSCLWYEFDHENNKKIPVEHRAVAGYLVKVRVIVREFREKENAKLELVISADETYILRSGIETNFTKTILLALSEVADFSKPLIFVVQAGNENVVFGKLYHGETKERIYSEWNADADFCSLINQIQDSLVGKIKQHSPWRNWKSEEDAIAWGQEKLPNHKTEFLRQEFARLKVDSAGKKSPGWVKRVEELVESAKSNNF